MEQLRYSPVDAGTQIKTFEELATAKQVKSREFLAALENCANMGESIKAGVVLGVLERVRLRRSDLRSVTASYIIGASNQLGKIGARPTDTEKEAASNQVKEYALVVQSVLHKLYPTSPTV